MYGRLLPMMAFIELLCNSFVWYVVFLFWYISKLFFNYNCLSMLSGIVTKYDNEIPFNLQSKLNECK